MNAPTDLAEPVSPPLAVQSESTWFERLALNLISYQIILIPIAIIVIATKLQICPRKIQNNVLIQMFVIGRAETRTNFGKSQDSERLLTREFNEPKRQKSTNTRPSDKIAFLWCFAGLQISYLIWGILQEKIMTTNYPLVSKAINTSEILGSKNFIKFHDSQFIVLLNRITAFIISILALVYNRLTDNNSRHLGKADLVSKPSAPLYEYVFCSISNILSSWCQLEALKFVNFPTQVISKSCKIIPVMLMSKILLHKRYQSFDYLCALMLSVGMFIFLFNQPVVDKSGHENNGTLPDIKSQTNQVTQAHADISEIGRNVRDSNLANGLVILALYLVFDSFTSNWQQSLFTRYEVSRWQMMAATNFYAILLTLTSLHQLGTLVPALKLLKASSSLLMDCVFISIMSSIGQLFVFYTIQRFGSVIFAVIMTLRQFFAILLSCLIYRHELTIGSSLGLVVVFFVAGLEVRRKIRAPKAAAPTEEASEPSFQLQFKTVNK